MMSLGAGGLSMDALLFIMFELYDTVTANTITNRTRLFPRGLA